MTRLLSPIAIAAAALAAIAVLSTTCCACASPSPAPTASSAAEPIVSLADPAPGAPDRGADPAVVALDIGGGLCACVLLAPDVALTARGCVLAPSASASCGGAGSGGAGAGGASVAAPSVIRVLVGDRLADAVESARGAAVLVGAAAADASDVPDANRAPCGPGVAAVILDAPVGGVRPMMVRPIGAARGDRLRTVGYLGLGDAGAVAKGVRDHLLVADATESELRIAEGCVAFPGGPAIDEDTGEVVGIAEGPGLGGCGGAAALQGYARADVAFALVDEAMARSAFGSSASAGGAKTRKGPVDMGGNCARGEDCASGVCVTDPGPGREYCSRTCDASDACPPRFHCRKSSYVGAVCVET